MVAATLSDTNAQVLGYLGGAILASCLVPQVCGWRVAPGA